MADDAGNEQRETLAAAGNIHREQLAPARQAELQIPISIRVDQPDWKTVKEYQDITYKKSGGVARLMMYPPIPNRTRAISCLIFSLSFRMQTCGCAR